MTDPATPSAATGARPFVDRHIGPDENAIAEIQAALKRTTRT